MLTAHCAFSKNASCCCPTAISPADLQNVQKLFDLLHDLPFFICFFSNLILFTHTNTLSPLVLNFSAVSPRVCLVVLTHYSPTWIFTPATDFTNGKLLTESHPVEPDEMLLLPSALGLASEPNREQTRVLLVVGHLASR